jgi:hypothetical protein
MIDDDLLDEELREAFGAAVAEARTGPDPYVRLLRRARRRRRTRLAVASAGVAAAAAAVVALVAVPTGLPSSGEPVGAPGTPIASDWVRRLIASPPRGSLSGDTQYVQALIRGIDRHRGSVEVSPELDRVAVLFVGDIGSTRVALVALSSEERALAVWFAAPAGASADRLASQAVLVSQGLEPFERTAYHARPYRNTQDLTFLVGVAPAGCVVDTAADAQHQAWQRAPGESFVALDAAATTDWWRVTCDGVMRYHGPAGAGRAGSVTALPQVSDAQLDAALTGARGSVDRDAARDAVRHLLNPLWAPAGAPRVLWGGAEPGTVQPMVVAAVPAADGWTIVVYRSTSRPDQAGPDLFRILTRAALDDPDLLYGLRINDTTGPSDRVLVLAPRDAATAVAIAPDGHETGRVALSSGTGWINTPKSTTLQALDANGEIVATYPLDSADRPPADGPMFDNW